MEVDTVAKEGRFESEKSVNKKGETFEYAFDSPGVFRYYCEPHRGQGIKGAVFVALKG